MIRFHLEKQEVLMLSDKNSHEMFLTNVVSQHFRLNKYERPYVIIFRFTFTLISVVGV